MGQILANLAVNARDAINDTGHLVIATRAIELPRDNGSLGVDLVPGKYIVITVSDDGCGMDDETLAKIFEPFFTTKEEGRGTGLGLATVYGILMQNKGAVTVASRPGQGTTFNLYLPQAQTTNSFSPEKNGLSSCDFGTETILLVEDEIAILELSVYILEKLNYHILTAATPALALNLAMDHPGPIDLLITDVIMPVMNGQELAEQIRVIRPDIKVLFISGYTADIISQHGVLNTGVHFLEKPFSARSLGKKVREVIDQS